MINKCPHCNMNYVIENNTSDYIHECNSSNDIFDKEDVVVMGSWTDADGASGTKAAQEVMMQGMENELQGRRAGIEGERKQAITRRGARATTHRQRNKLTFINLKEDNLQ